MDDVTLLAQERNIESLRADRINKLISRAENIDRDAAEELPALASEIESLASEAGCKKGIAESKLLTARYAAMKDDYGEAIRLASEALRQFEDAGDTMGRIKAMSTLGFSYGQLGKLDAALRHFLDGMELFDKCGFEGADAEGINGNLLNNLASIYGDLGRWDEALKVLEEVRRQAAKTGGAPLAVALGNICEAFLNKGDLVSALVYNHLAYAETTKKNLGSIHLYACHCSYGMIYERTGEPKKALESYTEALECASRSGNRFFTASALVPIGALRLRLGSRSEAAEALGRALALAEEIGANELQRTAHRLLVDCSEASGDFEGAYRHLMRHMEIDRTLEMRETERRLGNYSAELKLERLQKDAEIYRLRNVELKRKSDEIEESYRNIKAIGEIGQRLTKSLDADTVLSTTCESITSLMDADIFAIGLYDSSNEAVNYKAVFSNGERRPLFQVSAKEGSAASVVIGSNEAFMSNDSSAKYAENAAILGADAEGKPLRSAVCCPLMLAESVMGAILVECFRQDAYTERNFETARALASYIAIALNNARQSDELKAKAAELEQASRTDALTGLYNRRHAMEKLEEERVRFQRSARPFSIVICDIDFFKKVNDAHGHDCGDAVLKTLAGLLRRHIRGQDCLARWGGEEFLLLLPETGKEGAAVLAEKLRKRVEEHEFTYAGSKIPVTMTFGVAEYAGDYDIDAAIVGADGALYKGKNGGRNRVVVF